MNPLRIISDALSSTATGAAPKTPIYDIEINSLQGETVKLSSFEGKYILVVNVASKCGFTPQYKGLEALYQKYRDKLIIIGTPCNQFGAQEPGEANDIQAFCEVNYGVSFFISEKLYVKGPNQHALYKWLTDKSLNGSQDNVVRWNFYKFLISPEGRLLDSFNSITKPQSTKIEKYLR